MFGAHVEESSPFGSLIHNIDAAEAQDIAGDNTINVLDSPFASSCIPDNAEAAAAATSSMVNKAAASKGTQPNNYAEKSSSSSSAAGAMDSQTTNSLKALTDDVNNGSVVNILESPFSITQLDAAKLEERLSDAAAADALTSATAAVNLNCSETAQP